MTDPTATQTPAADPSASKRKFLLPVGLLAGGMALGAAFSPVGLASAQSDAESTESDNTDADSTESDSTEADSDASDADTSDSKGHHRGGERAAALAEFLGLTSDEIKAGIEADQTLVEIVAAAGTSEADLVAHLTTQATERLDQRVADGDLTEDEAAERLAAIEEKIADSVNTRPSERPDRGRGEGRRGDRGFGGSSVLEDLGITSEALQEGREAGMSLAEIAEAAGVSQEALVDALVAEATERANEAVEAGRLDADDVAERLADLEEKISERIEAEPGDIRQRMGRSGGRGLEGETVESGLDT